MKKTMSGGNLGSQKFEARRNMELFQAAVHDAKPSRETSKWREGVPKLQQEVHAEHARYCERCFAKQLGALELRPRSQ